jgi:Glycine cleavage H-protein
MFPGVDGFHWTAGHIIFLCVFFAVVLTIGMTVISAARRTVRDFRNHHAIDLCWHTDFADLPVADRRCRHELAGRVISRVCPNAFDCRACDRYSEFAVLPAKGMTHDLGFNYSSDRFYHRGHTWVKPEEDGTVTLGLDEFADHLVGRPDSVTLPEIGSQIDLNQTAWRMKKNSKEISVRAPIEGTVIAAGGPKEGWYLKLRPRLDVRDPKTFRHLLRGPEVHGWLSRELERLQSQLRTPDASPTLADGGMLMPDLMDAIPYADWSTVLADTFLEV